MADVYGNKKQCKEKCAWKVVISYKLNHLNIFGCHSVFKLTIYQTTKYKERSVYLNKTKKIRPVNGIVDNPNILVQLFLVRKRMKKQ